MPPSPADRPTVEQFQAFVDRTCALTVTDPHTPLADLGVDSLRTVALVIAAEDHYGVVVPAEALADPALTVEGLWRTVLDAPTAAPED
ncbi:acyl carrier protein [Streptomyces solincola]|uniref:Acyl carrier protein n=1 Tax=Streptomyces solincola TaxID=2100817 RepID=A0A2S9PQD9_9ACTN|nr:acyl carrier protein [Streptomyces solincola]PRH76630.1 acyl carrier protein [Streptomyces solincola]